MESLLISFSHIGAVATYAIVFIGMFIEGEAFLILSGILVRGDVIDYGDTLVIAFIAVVLSDTAYWFLGTRLGMMKRKKVWFIDMEKAGRLFQKLKKRKGLYIFMSKFAWGMNRLVLISSGYVKTPLKKLVKYSIPAAFIWTLTFVSIGYIFAERVGVWKKDLRMVIMTAAALFAIMVYIEHQVGRSIKEDAQIPNGD